MKTGKYIKRRMMLTMYDVKQNYYYVIVLVNVLNKARLSFNKKMSIQRA